LVWHCGRVCVLSLGGCGCFRRGPFYRAVEKIKHSYMGVLGQGFDQLATLQNLQQLGRRCAGREK
jgi:hypothetical protein